MTVKLSSLRVTAEMDVASYVAGAAQKESADKRMVESSKAVGQALAAQDAQAAKLGIGVASLSRSFIDGYAPAAKFETAIRALGSAIDKGLDLGRASATYAGIVTKFNQTADAAALARQNFVSLVPVVSAVNRQFEEMAVAQQRVAQARAEIARREAVGGALGRDINSRMGIGQGSSYTTDRLAVLERESARQFKAEVDAAIATRDAAAARSVANYRKIEDQLGRAGVGRQTGGYDPSRLAVLEAEATRQQQAEVRAEIARREAIGGALGRNINQRMGIGQGTLSASASGAVFEESFAKQAAADKAEFDRLMKAEQAKADRRKAEMEQRAEFLKQSLLPMDAEKDRNTQNLADINKLEKERVITIAQARDMRAAEALRTEQARKSIEGMFIHQSKYANATGLARNEVVNLSRQLQDVAVTLQAGQPLSTILLQQGTQIADIFASSNATMKGFFQQATSGVARFAMSLTGMATGLLAVGAAATYVGTAYGNSQREVERLVNGLGRGSGATVGNINSIAESVSAQQRISTSSARDIASQYAGTGRIGGGNIEALTRITRDYAAQTGVDLKVGADELAKAFSGDVVKGAEALNEKLGFLDNRTREYIRTLQEQGNRQGAIRATIDAMQPTIQSAAERVSVFAKAWERLKAAASNGVDAVGRAVAGQTTAEERLAQLTQQRIKAEAGGSRIFRDPVRLAEISKETAEIQEQIRFNSILQRQTQKAAEERRASMEAGTIIRDISKDEERIKDLRAELEKLNKVRGEGGQGAVGDQTGQNRAYDALQQAVKTALLNTEKLRKEGDLVVQGTMARTLEEQKAVAAQRVSIELEGQRLTSLERELILRRNLLEIQAQAAREARDANKSATDAAALAGLRPFEAAMLRNRQEVRDLRTRTESSQPAGGATIGPQSGFTRFGPFAVTNEGAAASTARGLQGLNADFAAKLQAFMEAVGGLSITSGKRTFDQQARLYAEKPHLAAPPGRSNHEFGLAADLAFATPEARARAHAMAADYGLTFPMKDRARNPEPWHVEPIGARAMRTGGGGLSAGNIANDNIRATNQSTLALKDEATAREFVQARIREQEDALKNQNEQLKLQEQNFQKSTYEVSRAAKEQELLQSFFQQGVPLTAALRAEVAQLAEVYGKTSANAAALANMQGAIKDRQMLFLSDTDRGIAGKIGYENLKSDAADYMRLTSAIQQSSEMASGFLNDIASAASRGKLGIDTLRNAALKLGDQIVSMMLNNAVRQFMGGMFGGAGGGGGGFGNFFSNLLGLGGGGFAPGATTGTGGLYANGGVFGAGTLSAFSNTVVSSPTVFPFAKGIGLMGEAGPEAIMPLKRGPGGSLGVQMHGAGGAAIIAPQVNMVVNNQTGAQVKQSTQPDGTIIVDILNGHLGQAVADSSSSRGPLSGMVDPRVSAAKRVG